LRLNIILYDYSELTFIKHIPVLPVEYILLIIYLYLSKYDNKLVL